MESSMSFDEYLKWQTETTKNDEKEEGYDTDLEDKRANAETPFDVWGHRIYKRVCRKMRIIPLPCVLRDLKTSHLSIKFRNLTVKDLLAIASALNDNSCVRKLDLEDNNLCAKGMYQLCEGLATNQNIVSLGITWNGLSLQSAAFLSEMLLKNETISKLDLSGNYLTDEHFHSLEMVVVKNRTLARLLLSKNKLSLESAVHIGHCIGHNQSLTELDLSWNLFNTDSVRLICKGLEENTTLRKISLLANGIGDIGAQYVATLFKVNSSLREVDLSNTKIGDGGAFALRAALQTNTALNVIKMNENPLTSVGVVALLQGCHENLGSNLDLLEVLGAGINTLTMDMYRDVRELHPKFTLVYSVVVDDAVPIVSPKQQRSINDESNAIKALQLYLTAKRRALLKYLRTLPSVNKDYVSIADFKRGLKAVKIPLTEQQMQVLIDAAPKTAIGEENLRYLIPDENFPVVVTVSSLEGLRRGETLIDHLSHHKSNQEQHHNET